MKKVPLKKYILMIALQVLQVGKLNKENNISSHSTKLNADY